MLQILRNAEENINIMKREREKTRPNENFRSKTQYLNEMKKKKKVA